MPGVDESAIAHGMRPEDGECPACGSSAPPEHLYRKWGYPIRRCLCGLGSTGLDANFDPGLLYSKDYFNGSRKDGYADYIGSRSILQREFQQTLRVLAEFGVTGGKLLEIGCAFGIFLETARQRFEVSGIEVCPEAAVHCRQRGLKVQTGAATGERIARDGPFDVIVMLDVIEHLPDPLDVVRAVGTELRPGGHLLITTGDWGSLVSRLMGSSWRLMTPPQHVYFFTRQTLASLLGRAGFRIVRCSRPAKQVPLNLILFQLSRMLGLQPGSIPFLNRFALPMNLFDAMRVIAVREEDHAEP